MSQKKPGVSFSPFVGSDYKLRIYGFGAPKEGETLAWYKARGASSRMFKAGLHGKSVLESWTQASTGFVLFAPVFAYTASKEARGEKLASFATDVGGWATHGMLSAGIQLGMTLVPGMSALKPGLRGLISMFAASFPNEHITSRVKPLLKTLSASQRRTRQFEMGQGYMDNEVSSNMRVAAMQDMSGSLMASRRVLGQEARFFHR